MEKQEEEIPEAIKEAVTRLLNFEEVDSHTRWLQRELKKMMHREFQLKKRESDLLKSGK